MTAASMDSLRLTDLSPVHAAAVFRLSALAGGNRTVDDWRFLLARGTGVGMVDADGAPVAAATALPYGRFAWIGPAPVAPDWRGQGIAALLAAEVVRRQEAAGRAPGLDATVDGRRACRRAGFRDLYRLGYYRAEAASPPPESAEPPDSGRPRVRRLAAADLEAVSLMDRRLFGADRLELLHHLRRRQPQAAFAAFRDGRLSGYVLARDGREAVQVGPLAATGDDVARALAAAALGAVRGPVRIDVADARRGLIEWLQASGFVLQWPLVRMVRSRKAGFGDPALLYATAGPDLG
ncbi:MAG: hypothetical protein OXH59_11995 [Rhodospirillaceae bacterium]|nr:hypothetical protein [Rhodospirillaceae bacterium]